MSSQTKSPQTVSNEDVLLQDLALDDYTNPKPVGYYKKSPYRNTFNTYVGNFIVGSLGGIPARDLAKIQQLQTLKGSGLTSSDQIKIGNGAIRCPEFGDTAWVNPENVMESDDTYATCALTETNLISSIASNDWSIAKPIDYYPEKNYRPVFTRWCQNWTLNPATVTKPLVLAEIVKMNTAKGSNISVTDLIKLQRRQILCPVFSGISTYLKSTNFGFTIPTNAQITGIRVEIEQKGEPYVIGATSALGIDSVESQVKLIKSDGTTLDLNKCEEQTHPGTEAYVAYPKVNSTWGMQWTPADINNSNFGVLYAVKGIGTVSVDNIRIVVDYVEGGY